jgi:ketosteroid isomerase-like protein
MLASMRTREQNLELIQRFWETLYRRDFDGVGAFFAADGTYVDVPTPDAGAVGPRGVAARLRLGLEPIEKQVHHLRCMVCDGKIAAWRDYWDLQTLLGRAPQWWIQHLATAKPEEWK